MNHKKGAAVLMASLLALTLLVSFSHGQGQGGGQADRPSQVDRDRVYDRDRQWDRDRLGVHDRDRDRLHVQDYSQLKDKDIYGSQLMSAEERNQYRKELQNAKTAQKRMKIQAQHHEQMQARANAQGLDLVPPGQGPIYGGNLMSVRERNEYRTELRFAESDQERAQLLAQHREAMQARAKQQGVEPEEIEEAE